jgi:hypothetical protein
MFFDEYERVIKELKTNIRSLDLNMEFENIKGRLESFYRRLLPLLIKE